MRRAALARRHAADHLRAIGQRLFGVESAGGTGHPLRDDIGILVDEDGHIDLTLACFDKWKIASNNLDQRRTIARRSEYIFLVLRTTRPISAKDRTAYLRNRIKYAQERFSAQPSKNRQN